MKEIAAIFAGMKKAPIADIDIASESKLLTFN